MPGEYIVRGNAPRLVTRQGSAAQAGLQPPPGPRQQPAKLAGPQRARKVEALRPVAPQTPQFLDLLLRLDAVARDLAPQCLGPPDDRVHDRRRALTGTEPLNERIIARDTKLTVVAD